MSNADVDTTIQPAGNSDSDAWTTDAEDEGNHPVTSSDKLSKSTDIPDPTATTKQGWNGDPMDWESWPTGRPGPVVSEARMQEAMEEFQVWDKERDEQSRTKEKVVHFAEFSSSCRGALNAHSSQRE